MGLYITAVVMFIAAYPVALVFKFETGADVLIFLSLTLFAFAVLRSIWRAFNSGAAARTGGKIAAKVANQADSFKEAYKDNRGN